MEVQLAKDASVIYKLSIGSSSRQICINKHRNRL